MHRGLCLSLVLASIPMHMKSMDDSNNIEQRLEACEQQLTKTLGLFTTLKEPISKLSQAVEQLPNEQRQYQDALHKIETIQHSFNGLTNTFDDLHTQLRTLSSTHPAQIITRDANALFFTLPLALCAYIDHRLDALKPQETEPNTKDEPTIQQRSKALCAGIRSAVHRTSWALLCNSLTPLVGMNPVNGWCYALIYGYIEGYTQPMLSYKPLVKNSQVLMYCAKHPKIMWACKALAAYILTSLAT